MKGGTSPSRTFPLAMALWPCSLHYLKVAILEFMLLCSTARQSSYSGVYLADPGGSRTSFQSSYCIMHAMPPSPAPPPHAHAQSRPEEGEPWLASWPLGEATEMKPGVLQMQRLYLYLWLIVNGLEAAPLNLDTAEPVVIRSPALEVDSEDGFGWAAILHQVEQVGTGDSMDEALRKTRWFHLCRCVWGGNSCGG